MSTRLLASACAWAGRLQVSLEGLSAASNLLPLAGVGASFAVSYLSGLMTNRGLRLSSNEMSRRARFGLEDGLETGAALP